MIKWKTIVKDKQNKEQTKPVPLTSENTGKTNIPSRGTFDSVERGGFVTNTLPAPTKPGTSGGSNKQGK